MLKVAPIDNPTQVRSVSEKAWKNWPKVKSPSGGFVEGQRLARGRVVYAVVSDEQVERAKSAPREPVQVPPEVTRIVAAPPGVPAVEEQHFTAAELIEKIKATTTKEEAIALAGNDERKTVANALAAHLEKLS